MHLPQLFNPYIIATRHGVISSQESLHERMCLWYELELIPESSEDSGVITLDSFIPLKKGTLMLRKPGDIVKGISPVSYNYMSIMFDCIYDPALEPYYAMGDDCSGGSTGSDFFEIFYKNDRNFQFINDLPGVIQLSDNSNINILMLDCIRYFESSIRDRQIYARSVLLQILTKLHSSAGSPVAASIAPKSSAVARSIEYMRQNYMNPISLDLLAQQVSMSREYFCRLFKANTGLPPMAFLQHIRIFHAKSLLLTTTLTVEEIASACGYDNVNYFYSVFRKACGITPSQYRK